MLSINSEGIVSLPDGRVVNTVAAAQFRLVPRADCRPNIYLMSDTTKFTTPDEAEVKDLVVNRALADRYVEEHLASGLTVAMYGVAEGRRLDGSVQTATTWWKVCAL
jgi:hypothetical protein